MRSITAGVLAAACGFALTGSLPTASALAEPPAAVKAEPDVFEEATWERVVRRALQRFQDPKVAERHGYTRTDVCKQYPFKGPRGEYIGAMGYHYVNKNLAADPKLDLYRPEILVYVPGRNGERRLGAIEYLKYDHDDRLATADDRPSLLGKPFDGPFPPLEDGMPSHYSLHVWLFKPNPRGLFEPWNPAVRCPMAEPALVKPGMVKPGAARPGKVAVKPKATTRSKTARKADRSRTVSRARL